MRIEINGGYIENLKNPTQVEIGFIVKKDSDGLKFSLNLRQLTMLRNNFDDIISYLQEDHEANDDS